MEDKRPQFGSRKLEDENQVFEHNAWDDVQWDDEQESNALEKVAQNSSLKVSEDRSVDFEQKASSYWNSFYDIHSNKFFKDRHWLFVEFPELDPSVFSPVSIDSGVKIFEIGCGVGNTVLPILRHVPESQKLHVFASDFSKNAIDILKENRNYDENRCTAFVLDATSDDWCVPFDQGTIDIVVLIFAMSAINPNRFEHIAKKISDYLRPGGLVLFRDYGRYDMAQLRFKNGQCLTDNFYVRGDGTRVYFFTQDDVRNLFHSAGLVEEQNIVDRRLQVNRGKMLKMYRVWVQAKYRKPSS